MPVNFVFVVEAFKKNSTNFNISSGKRSMEKILNKI